MRVTNPPPPAHAGPVLVTCLIFLAGAVVLLIVGSAVLSWWGAPTIEVRNDSGQVLTNVRLEAFQIDAGNRVAEADSLEPGESICVSGRNLDYPLVLGSVAFGGIAGAKRTQVIGDLKAHPYDRSVYVIDAEGRLADERRALGGPCICPDRDASGKGSFDCPIFYHREEAAKATLAPRSTR